KWIMEMDHGNGIECLPSELFYECFDYLDPPDIYRAFYNLNLRLNTIIDGAIFPHLNLTKLNKGNQIQNLTKSISAHHVLSLNIAAGNVVVLVNTCVLNKFSQLQALSISSVSNSVSFKCLIEQLPKLGQLKSLEIDRCDFGTTPMRAESLKIIFSLSTLKHLSLLDDYHFLLDDDDPFSGCVHLETLTISLICFSSVYR
ncbi:unnamed protein product, partial [Didymodactylos carnosus]